MIIKYYYFDKHYWVKRLLKEFLIKTGEKEDLGIYCVKLTKLRFVRIPRNGRSPTYLTNEDTGEAEELIPSQEQSPRIHKSQGSIERIIGVSQSSVSRMSRQYFGLTTFCKTKVQDLSDADNLRKVLRGKRLLRSLTVANVDKTFLNDEKFFKLNQPRNTQNN